MSFIEDMYLQYCNTDGKGLIPTYMVMGNEQIYDYFNGDLNELYKYCIDKRTNWADVIDYEVDETAIY